ncbi:hypothetical protein C5C13_13390 [Clavibacter michiganensis]|nr:hypothetical protein C5C13_13390 [Clavibacter michiganensis]
MIMEIPGLTAGEQDAWHAGFVSGQAHRQAEVDELDDLADRYYRAAYGDERRLQIGANVLASLHTGDSVLVVGYEVTRTWEKEGKPRFGRVIEADAIGPNLAHATTVITPQRRSRATSAGE